MRNNHHWEAGVGVEGVEQRMGAFQRASGACAFHFLRYQEGEGSGGQLAHESMGETRCLLCFGVGLFVVLSSYLNGNSFF